MVKTIRISLDEVDHEKFDKIKGERTWLDVLVRGVESIEEWPENSEWKKAVIAKIEEEC